MTRRRWIADEVSGNRAALTGDQAAHLVRVLRVRVGQEFDIATGERVRRGCVISAVEDKVEFQLAEDVASALPPEITVVLSVFKFDRMEWAIEKLTELGAARIIPVIARRTEAHLAQAAEKRVERWRRIAREAAQQARLAAAPEIASPVRAKDAMTIESGTRIVLSEAEEQVSLKHALGSTPMALAFGPEGGWTPEELEQFAAAGWKTASLGNTILRAETAAIAAVAVAMAELQS